MYTRMTSTQTDLDKLDAVIANFKEKGPGSQNAPGYAGWLFLVNRGTGEGVAWTYWETLKAMNAAEQFAQEHRRGHRQQRPGHVTIDVDRFELVVVDRKGDPSVPAFALLTEMRVDPHRLDRVIEIGRSQVPDISAQQGCQALIAGVNSMTGRFLTITVWNSLESRAAANANVTAGLQKVAEMSGSDTAARVTEWEVPILELKQLASV